MSSPQEHPMRSTKWLPLFALLIGGTAAADETVGTALTGVALTPVIQVGSEANGDVEADVPQAEVACSDLVNGYHNERFEHPTDGMPDVFPRWEGTETLFYTYAQNNTRSSTGLICDPHGSVKRLRFSYVWKGEKNPDKAYDTEFGFIVLADSFSDGTGLITDLFERSDSSTEVERMNLPGPYSATVQVSTVTPAGGFITLVVERDEFAPKLPGSNWRPRSQQQAGSYSGKAPETGGFKQGEPGPST
jgi:hypothetical protein